ncbi:MAG TPA: hypothetical protein VHL12_01690 [Gemmatimonadaceae bacterium]|nr:hypothetical protein [Gemmatimonadaceae bacterium]
MGATLKPALLGPSVATLRGTNPACERRFSTLQSAHAPVGGQSERFFVPVELDAAAEAGTSATTIAVSDALLDPPERPHPTAATIEMQRIGAITRVMGMDR